jgi:PGF-pre-PGF domain-containing protein
VTQFNYTAGTLAAGTYTYTWWANNSLLAYFNSSNQTFQVNQSYLPITLYINGTNDDSTAYNYSVANITANFSSSFSFNITLWTNLTGSWTLLDNEPSPITNNTDLTPYQAANYLVIANWTGNANYTISSASHYLTLAYYIEPPTPPAGGTGGWSAPSGPSQGGQQSVTFMTIEAGVASIAKYTDKLLDVREINITVSNPANAVKITVSKVDEQPAFITHSITGTVYKYFNITTQNLDESNVAKARLKFRVNKTWYSENNLNPATTKLNRYESNGWRTLSTTQTTSDTDYYYFEAETPGFSTFAVTATKTAQPAPTTCTNTCQPGQSQRAYPDCTCYTPAQPSGGGITPTAPNYDWLIFIMVVVIVTLVLVSMVKKHVKRTHKHHK